MESYLVEAGAELFLAALQSSYGDLSLRVMNLLSRLTVFAPVDAVMAPVDAAGAPADAVVTPTYGAQDGGGRRKLT